MVCMVKAKLLLFTNDDFCAQFTSCRPSLTRERVGLRSHLQGFLFGLTTTFIPASDSSEGLAGNLRSSTRSWQMQRSVREGIQKKIDFFLGKSPKLWVGGGQES